MQAVILAAGKGTRMENLTDKIPKPLLKIDGKPILEWALKSLPDEIAEVIVVVGYYGEEIIRHFGDRFKDKKIRYVKQGKLLGTAHALQICKKFLKPRFLVMMGDNIYSKKDIRKCLKLNRSVLVYKSTDDFSGNQVLINRNIFSGLEKVNLNRNAIINTGLYVLDRSFFDLLMGKTEKNELGIPQTLAENIKKYPVNAVKTNFFVQINTASDLEKAKDLLS